jgi:hypothetical protein
MGISAALGSSALLPAGLGFRNVLINGEFRINQRGYTSGSNLASGSYGFDRWKSNFTNTTLTFTSAPQGQIVTINAGGSIRQVIERANIVPGTYILSWTGTAGGRVYNEGASTVPSYNTGNSLTFVLDGTANVNVEFAAPGSTATLGNAQLERNFQPTPFEQRPIGVELALCQRYYEKSFNQGVTPGATTDDGAIFAGSGLQGGGLTTGYIMGALRFMVTKRAAPTVTVYDRVGNANKVGADDTASLAFNNQAIQVIVIGDTGCRVSRTSGNNANLLVFHYVAVAEL